jgi:aryl-alcohol dehydrogenase-like predicted oxidoreductase
MIYKHLGRSGLDVSRLCLGTMNFGVQTDEQTSFRIMDRALELGINFFDTANVYGWKIGEGITENIIGRWFAQGGGRREKVVIATKLFGKMSDWPNGQKYSALAIRRECEASLKRLQTDHIDLYQFHHVWRDIEWDEVWQAMELLVAQGKIIYNGSSNFAGWHIAQASEAAKRRNYLGLVSEQSLYNLNARIIEMEVLPACKAYGVGVIPWSPLASGLLAGRPNGADAGGRRDTPRTREMFETNKDKVDRFEQLCETIGEEPAHVAMAWVLKNEVVTATIIGPRTIEQLNSMQRALQIELSQDTLTKLDEIFPGPGGTSPEAYAW